MLNAIVLLHRWLGIAFALLFAMWFATGMVMHFVPFPSLTETDRFAGLSPIAGAPSAIGPGDAVKASGITDAARVRLIQRSDGPVYVVSGLAVTKAVRATDGTDAAITSPDLARAAVSLYARNRGIESTQVSVDLADYDQWSVPNGFDRYRPLYRVALGDIEGTEVYVASTTGEIVLQTTRHARVWNYVGSVVHWIYPTVLRRDWALWDRVVSNGSLLAVLVALLGAALGVVRIRRRRGRLGTPYRGWHAWHHVLGLVATIFVLTWSISGWLSMDHGRLFSRGQLTPAETAVASPLLDWRKLTTAWPPLASGTREVEWFAFDGRFDRRDRVALDRQVVSRAGEPLRASPSGLLDATEIQHMTARLGVNCGAPTILPDDDAYAIASLLPGAPVDRVVCGDVWFDIDAASGTVLQRLDSSRRAYRWAYTALHTLDFPVLLRYPGIRTALVLGLCSLGLLFSLTGIVIGWRRLRLFAG